MQPSLHGWKRMDISMTVKSLLLAAILVLPGCAILPDEADLVNALPPPEAYEGGIVIPGFASP